MTLHQHNCAAMMSSASSDSRPTLEEEKYTRLLIPATRADTSIIVIRCVAGLQLKQLVEALPASPITAPLKPVRGLPLSATTASGINT